MNTRCGIYQITNTTNKKIYIGSSLDMRKRITNHKIMLRNNKHGNPHLQSSWNKYGEKSFEFRWLILCDKESLCYFEQLLLDNLKPDYNISSCAEVPMRGQKYTDEQLINHPRGESHPWFGRVVTEEEREKRRARATGNHYGLGYKHTEDARIKMSEAGKGRVWTEEHRRKIGEANSRRILSDETKAKISASKKGKQYPPRTEEHCRKISEALRNRSLALKGQV